MPRHQGWHYPMKRRILSCASAAWLFAVSPSLCLADYNVDTLAAAMSASEAQVSDIRFHFNLDGRNATPDNVDSRVYSDVWLAMKQPAGCLLYDIRSASSNTGVMPAKAEDDEVLSFDGSATVILDRRRDAWGRCTAVVIPGFAKQQFSGLENPQQYIWGLNGFGLQWAEVLRRNRDTFQVSPGPVPRVDGVPTVLVTGHYRDTPSTTVSIWVAPSRGFLPVQVEMTYEGGRTGWRNLRHLSEVAPHVWYPLEIVDRTEGESRPPNTVTLDHIDCSPLPLAAFRPPFPPGTHVTDHVAQRVFDTPVPATRRIDAQQVERSLSSYLGRADAATRPTTAESRGNDGTQR
jgi:hypothetical protein